VKADDGDAERGGVKEMCGIAVIISGIRIDASSLLLDSVPPASASNAEQVKVILYAYRFFCFPSSYLLIVTDVNLLRVILD
jgi:hypothetical protein